MMYKKIITTGAVIAMAVSSVSAFQSKITAQYFNGPSVSSVTDTTATFSLSEKVLKDISAEELSGVYFEVSEPGKMCIAIYPTPASCLPKKLSQGSTTVTVTELVPNTTYSVVYKHDNTIRCITTPCPENSFESLSVTFTTKNSASHGNGNNVKKITRSLSYRSGGEEVKILQNLLITRGFMKGVPTGHFGIMTMKAVKDFQRSYGFTPTGAVGPLTRKALNEILANEPIAATLGEKFSGNVESVSTACFHDAVCDVVVSGKKVVLVAGFRQQSSVGTFKGVPTIESIGKCIGSSANVYAKKIDDGYTLYGSTDYYVEIVGCGQDR